nr:uncharacterized protein LOC124813304 [Hydra vulgaris]XP_047136150.1 uncharacterized protein LOC124813304 [Hydra vulgaris]
MMAMENRAERFNIQEDIRLNILVNSYEKQKQDSLRNMENSQRHLALQFQQKFSKEISKKNEHIFLQREKMNSVGSLPFLSSSYENISILELKHNSVKTNFVSPLSLRRHSSTQVLIPQIKKKKKFPLISASSLPSSNSLVTEQPQQTYNRITKNKDCGKTLTKSKSDSSISKSINESNIFDKDLNKNTFYEKRMSTTTKMSRKNSLKINDEIKNYLIKDKIQKEKIEHFFKSIEKLNLKEKSNNETNNYINKINRNILTFDHIFD